VTSMWLVLTALLCTPSSSKSPSLKAQKTRKMGPFFNGQFFAGGFFESVAQYAEQLLIKLRSFTERRRF
jgi:hypothetical protein